MQYYATTETELPVTEHLLDKAIAFAADYLNLDVDLVIEFETLDEGYYGYCDFDNGDDEAVITVSDRLSVEDIVRTIFHELVHVKQYDDGRLKNGSPQRWMGEVYDVEYHNRPWEIEAFKTEEKMMMSVDKDFFLE